jgi:hypothetical protein
MPSALDVPNQEQEANMNYSLKSFAFAALVALGIFGMVALPAPAGAAGSRATPLVGTFKLSAGNCATAKPTGTYFRMIFPGGSLVTGKFFDNPDSTCTDKSYTLAVPGTAGGLATGKFQPNPAPAFSASGGALADAIIEPQLFTAINFSIATDPKDPQTGTAVPPPAIKVKNGKLSGQIQAWSAAWNKLYFNQGSPKPGGTSPGLTQPVTGTYNAKTRAFVLTWASAVVGGPFNGFTGYWHLQGRFIPSKK